MQKSTPVIVILILFLVISLAANVFLGMSLVKANQKNQELEQSIHVNTKILDFANLFIDKVLGATGEISFDDRLKIENAVRDTQDKEIYDQWQKFVAAPTEADGRTEVKNLFQLIINKLST